jgi:hypothetical protein
MSGFRLPADDGNRIVGMDEGKRNHSSASYRNRQHFRLS